MKRDLAIPGPLVFERFDFRSYRRENGRLRGDNRRNGEDRRHFPTSLVIEISPRVAAQRIVVTKQRKYFDISLPQDATIDDLLDGFGPRVRGVAPMQTLDGGAQLGNVIHSPETLRPTRRFTSGNYY